MLFRSVLRKVPQDVLDRHYDSDGEHEASMIRRMDLHLTCTMPVCLAALNGLLTVFYHRKELGTCYAKALRILTEGACEKMVEP